MNAEDGQQSRLPRHGEPPRNVPAELRCFGLMLAATLAERAHPIQATKRVTPRMSWIAALGMSASGEKSKKFSRSPIFWPVGCVEV
jgi:hypothetical protein